MKTLFIHVSDIHWKSSFDISNERFRKVGSSTRAVIHEQPDVIVMIYSGDLAWSGESEQYLELYNLLDDLENGLKEAFHETDTIVRVVVPGNHDCNFSNDQSARELLMTKVLSDKSLITKPSLMDNIMSVQSEFFEFRDSRLVDISMFQPLWSKADSRLGWKQTVETPIGKISLISLNSAWMSRLHEKQGSLLLPDQIDLLNEDEILLQVTVMHHPLTWIEHEQSREWRNRILSMSDILFTGHEHESGSLTLSEEQVGKSEIYEANAFFDHTKKSNSGFSALLVDPAEKTKKHINFHWDGNNYTPLSGGQVIEANQPLLSLNYEPNLQRRNRALSFKSDFQEHLESLELDIIYNDSISAKLQDLYVWPDAIEFSSDSNYEKTKSLQGDKLVVTIQKHQAVFVLGADQSGKSALCKALMLHFRDDGLIPILLSGEKAPHKVDDCRRWVGDAINVQYGNEFAQEISNRPKQDKIVIIDDYQLLKPHLFKDHSLIPVLLQNASRVIISCHDTAIGPLDIGKFALKSDGAKHGVISLQPMAYSTRSQLITKWLKLKPALDPSSEEYAKQETHLHRLVDAIIGNNYVQPYPAYILAVLQSVEAGQELDMSASTHGHFYEVFIKAAMAKQHSVSEIDILNTFTGFLAYQAHTQQRLEFGEDFIDEAHKIFEDQTDLTEDLQDMKKALLDARLLRASRSQFRFSEQYIFYYFIAYHMKSWISEPDVLSEIRKCASAAWHQNNANILLFLAHLSKERAVVEILIENAERFFPDTAQPALDDDVANLNVTLHALDLDEDEEISEHIRRREQERASADVILPDSENHRLTAENDIDENIKLLNEMAAALKILQVLGQVLKSFPATFKPEEKVQIVNVCVGLGLRTLGRYFTLAKSHDEVLMREFTQIIKGQLPGLQKEEAEARARSTIQNLSLLCSFGIVKRLSYGIGSKSLGKTYAKVFSGDMTPARSLIKTSLMLDHSGKFPETSILELAGQFSGSRLFALRILRALVLRHFRLFHTDFRLRARIGSKLNLRYNSPDTLSSGKKLVSKH